MSHQADKDLTLGAFIEYAKLAAYGAQQDYIKRQNRIKSREYTMDELPQPLDTTELVDMIPRSVKRRRYIPGLSQKRDGAIHSMASPKS